MSIWSYVLVALATTAVGFATHSFPWTIAFFLSMFCLINCLDNIYQELKQLNKNKTDSP